VDLLTVINGLVAHSERKFAEALSGLLSSGAEHILRQELEVVVASNEVDAAGSENDEHDGGFLHAIEALHEAVGPAGARELGHLLVRASLCVLDPVAELTDAILVVVVAIALEHEVVAIGKDFGKLPVRVTLAADWAHRRCEQGDACEIRRHHECNELVCELAHATGWARSDHQEGNGAFLAEPDLSGHAHLAHRLTCKGHVVVHHNWSQEVSLVETNTLHVVV